MGVFGASKREAYCRSDEFLDQTNGLPYNSSASRAGNIYRSILIIFVLFFVLFGCFILLSSSTVGLFFFRISLDVLSPKVFNYNLNNPRGIEKSCWDGLWASQGASGNNNCCLGNTRFNQSWNNWFWFFFFSLQHGSDRVLKISQKKFCASGPRNGTWHAKQKSG